MKTTKTITRWLTALVMTCAITAMAGEANTAASAKDDGWEIASALDVPGKGGWTTCALFARNLEHRFTVAGGEYHVVVYDWTDAVGFGQRHALFVFRDAAGRYWGIDNRHAAKWLPGTTPAAWVDFWEPDKKTIRLVAEISNPKLLGKTADKGRLDHLLGDTTLVATNP